MMTGQHGSSYLENKTDMALFQMLHKSNADLS